MASIEERAEEFAEREYICNQYEKERISFGYYHGATDTLKKLRLPSDDDDKLASEVMYKGVKIIPPVGFLVGKITSVDNTTGINEGIIVEFVKV